MNWSNRKCIYCGKGTKESDFATSHIIPDSLSNSKVKFDCVCDPKHNANFSREFEKPISDQLAYLRNRLDIYSDNRPKKKVPYKAIISIEGFEIETSITSKFDFYNSGPKFFKDKDGKGMLFFNENEDINLPNGDMIDVDINNSEIYHNIQINLDMFSSSEMLRLVAKIAYEWYCKIEKIYHKDGKYKRIINFVTKLNTADESIIQVVNDLNLYKSMKEVIGIGGHALGLYHAYNGNVYVYLSFFNLVIYRIRIFTASIYFAKTQIIQFEGNTVDGTKLNFKIKINSESGFNVLNPDSGIKQLTPYLKLSLDDLNSLHYFALRTHKSIVAEIRFSMEKEYSHSQFEMLIGYKEPKKLIVLFILFHLGKHANMYNKDLSFDENLNIILADKGKEFEEDMFYEHLKKLYYNKELKKHFLEGCEMFFRAFELEIVEKGKLQPKR
jgi:hypothetical protein